MRRSIIATGCLLAFAMVAGPAHLLAQEGGTITGRVTDKTTGGGIPSVQISIVGTQIRVVSNDSGFYRIRRVPTGSQTVRALRLGYSANTVTVTIADNGTATADLALTAAASVLSRVEITGTGQQKEAREVATFTPSITGDSLNLAATPNFASVLEGTVPGVQVVQSSGTTGAGARIRIRGASSVSLSNEPLLVIDGVEVDNNPNSFGLNPLSVAIGGQVPSRLNDINPEEIESVQTLQGPAATGLYGTAAANGVIVITTKHGVAGQQRWNGFVENGEIHDKTDYPDNYGSYSHVAGGASRFRHCLIWDAVAGNCTIDSLAHYNPLRGQISPIRVGRRQQYSLNTSGGSDVNQFFVSGDYQLENGTDNVNQLQKTNGRANFTTRPRNDLSISVSTGYVWSNLRLPQNDNNILGNLSEGLLGSGRSGPTHNFGYFSSNLNPAVMSNIHTFEDVQRFTPSLQLSYQPLSWLTANANSGFDIVNQDDIDGTQPNLVPFANLPLGDRFRNRLEDQTYTINVNSSATAHLPADVTSTTTIGGSWRRVLDNGTFTQGFGLTGGSNSQTGTTQLIQVSEINQDNRVLGGFLQQQFGWRDKLFVSGGVRLDKNSSTGVAAGTTAYPTGQVSYVISEEPWFPHPGALTALKLRLAFGQSGLHPDFLNALTYKNPVTAVSPASEPSSGFTAGNPGNPNLKPERTTEIETGFDLSLLRDRLSIGLTYYDKHTQDALIQQVLVPSLGDTTFRWINIGKVRNRGLELQTTANVITSRPVTFSVTANYSTLQNRLQQLGSINGQAIQPIIFGLGGATQEHHQGFPLGGYWQFPYTYSDANHDGVIDPSEVTLGATRKYLGSSLPTEAAALSPQLVLFRFIKLTSLFDFSGGAKLYNGTGDFRCGQFANCRDDFVKTSLANEARIIADGFYGSVAGYIEDATYWKWREASIGLIVPPEYAAKIHARGAQITFAARNLHTWTKYGGLDPELSQSAQTNFTSADFLTQPPVRYYTVRVTLNY